jgi:exodeoxyribonuclease-1
MLDVVRMTRALRPDGIIWPVKEDGTPVNKLELLTKENGIDHANAHDALADVVALIEVTKLLKTAQPQLYSYLFAMRDKNEVKKLVNLDDKQPFVYTSGRYEQEHRKTTVAFPLTSGKNGNVVVYDLRYDPEQFINLSTDELAKKLFATYQERKEPGFVALPVKELQYNRAPAIAPLGVLEKEDGWNAIHLSPELIETHKKALLKAPHFAENIRSLYERAREFARSIDVEAQLYDGFVPDSDKIRIEAVRNADERMLADFHPEFTDERLSPLLLHYKARNYPRSLSETEAETWEQWRAARINTQLPTFLAALRRLASTTDDTKGFLLQELQLWAESVVPVED